MSCSYSRHHYYSHPVSNTLGKAGARCAPRKRDCQVLPLGPVLAVLCGWSCQCLGFAAWRVSEMAEERAGQDSSSWVMVTGRGEAAPGLAAASALPAASLPQPGVLFPPSPGWKEQWACHLRGLDVPPASCSWWWCCACTHTSCNPPSPVRGLGLAWLFAPISLLLAVTLVSRQSLKNDVHTSTKKSIILFSNCIVCSEFTYT